MEQDYLQRRRQGPRNSPQMTGGYGTYKMLSTSPKGSKGFPSSVGHTCLRENIPQPAEAYRILLRMIEISQETRDGRGAELIALQVVGHRAAVYFTVQLLILPLPKTRKRMVIEW